MRKALAIMPENCGIKFKNRSKRQPYVDSFEYIVMLMYADNVVLMSHDPMELSMMLDAVDKVAVEFGMQINASKTEIQIQQWSGDIPHMEISSGKVQVVEEFKYLGSWIQNEGCMDKEINTRKGRTYGVFQSYEKVWSNKKLKIANKMAIYNSIVLPHLLYGCETWNCSLDHFKSLEVVHSNCLRRIMGVNINDRHTLSHIYSVCQSQPIVLTIVKRTFQWLGHVCRMSDQRTPQAAYHVDIPGRRCRGRPKGVFRNTHSSMLKLIGVDNPGKWLSDMIDCAKDREKWRTKVANFEIQEVPIQLPTRRSTRIANR